MNVKVILPVTTIGFFSALTSPTTCNCNCFCLINENKIHVTFLFVLYFSGSLGCPFGWLHNKNSCYFVQDQLKTWEQAKIFCEKLDNSNLLVVGKDDEVYFLFVISFLCLCLYLFNIESENFD